MSEPLRIMLAGYDTIVTKRETDVLIQIYFGVLGWQNISIPLAQWQQIEDYVRSA